MPSLLSWGLISAPFTPGWLRDEFWCAALWCLDFGKRFSQFPMSCCVQNSHTNPSAESKNGRLALTGRASHQSRRSSAVSVSGQCGHWSTPEARLRTTFESAWHFSLALANFSYPECSLRILNSVTAIRVSLTPELFARTPNQSSPSEEGPYQAGLDSVRVDWRANP